jgi:hypothetical protein
MLASDPDLPMNTLAFSLLANAPVGAVIEPTTGRFTWTPSENYGGSTNRLNVIVTDNGGLSATQMVTIIVNEANSAPTWATLPTKTVDEGSELSLVVAASDSDTPANSLMYSLAADAPSGATISPTTGRFSWMPSETQGPSTNAIKIIATDNGIPSMSATQALTVVVKEVNSAPELVSVPSQTAYALSPLRVTNIVVDPDIPTNRMTFQLAPGAPSGARINTNNGVFAWTPSRAQAPSSNYVTVIVTDNGVPPLSATNSFSVVVGDFAELSLGSAVVRAGRSGSVPITMNSSAGITNLLFLLDTPEDRLTNFTLSQFLPDVAGSLQPNAPNRSFIILNAIGSTPLSGSRELSTLAFTATTNEPSGIIPLSVLNLSAMQGNGVLVPRTIANNGRVVIVGEVSLLEALVQTNSHRTLILYGKPGTSYTVEYNTNLLDAVSWNIHWQGTLTNLFQSFDLDATDYTIFYRARE